MTSPGFDDAMSKAEDVSKVVFDVVTKKGNRPLPLRLPLGVDAYILVMGKVNSTKKDMEAWKDISESTMDTKTRALVEKWTNALA